MHDADCRCWHFNNRLVPPDAEYPAEWRDIDYLPLPSFIAVLTASSEMPTNEVKLLVAFDVPAFLNTIARPINAATTMITTMILPYSSRNALM
jgi:hypothetical protein